MYPIPRFISKILTLPLRLLLRKEQPESGKDVAIVFVIYLGIMVLLSLLFNAIDILPRSGLWGFPDNVLSTL